MRLLLLVIFTFTNFYAQIEPTVTYDEQSGNYIIEYEGFIGENQELVHLIYEPTTKVIPSIDAQIKKNIDLNYYIYSYYINNSSMSIQRITKFCVDVFSNIFDISKPNDYWYTGYYSYIPVFRWLNSVRNDGMNSPLNGIAPDSSISGFSFSSYGLPSIGNSYFIGNSTIFLSFPDEGNEKIIEMLRPLRKFPNNSVIKKTVCPKDPPDPYIPIEFIDTLKTYADSSYALGWIKNEQTKDKYNAYFNNTKNHLNQNNNNAAKTELQKVLTDCIADSSSVLTSEAYALLYFNTEYLINKIQDNYPQNNIYAKVRAKVVKKKNGNLKYKYKLKNKAESEQEIALFYVKEQTDTLAFHSPRGWISGEIPESNLFYFKSDSSGAEINPGDKQKGFSVKAERLPYVSNYYIQSERVVIDSTEIYTNSTTGYTLSPALSPSPFIALEFIDTLISYNARAYELGWIKNENVNNKFNRKLNKAKTKLENGKERKAKEILREFVQLVRRKWCSRKITSEGLALLKFNAQYLIKHVGPPDLEDNLGSVTLIGVERIDGENRRYKYKVDNSVNNPDKLSAFYVKESVDEFTADTPEDWTQTVIDSLDLICYNTEVNTAMIKPDKNKKGYRIKVESLPVIMPFYLLVKDQPPEADTILYNSITGFTLGPESLPVEFVGLEQVDNLYEHVEEANDIDWIKKESVYEKLIEKVEEIRNKVEKDKNQQAKNKLEDFVEYVQDKYDQDKLTKEARILFKQNANYIKRNL